MTGGDDVQEFTIFDLQKIWKLHGFTNWRIAEACHVSEGTVQSWLRTNPKERAIPHPDNIGDIEHALGLESELIWHRWMMSNCESYRERHQNAMPNGLLGAIVSVRHELSDVLALQDPVERDAVDNVIDDPVLRAKYRAELEHAQSSITALLCQIPKE